jgi:adenylate cyclase
VARQAQALVPETIPFISDRARATVGNEYLTAADHKALAISPGQMGFITGQGDDETAKSVALDVCQKRADVLPQQRKCEVYAVGDTVVYAHGRPPMPPPPWVAPDQSIARPLAVNDIPLVRDTGKATIEKSYVPGHAQKALALGPLGGFFFLIGQESTDEAERRVLELCGHNAGVPCLLVALNDNFVVPVPMTMKPTGFFRPAAAGMIAADLRDDLERRLGNGGGWTAVAVGAGGQVGLMLKAASEQNAVDGALADCAKRDSTCHVIAIGPFAVEPK